ncbi:hypothetical protein P775_28675 [Puniceibacterium antarcticum]|uniref:Uncharacterized protein n=1 Tax=Puniceibacterium antarcticum TaxID=1206336 RepID=A0A2G8QQY6_9RHOB|nr:hypothetical protein [Puniceibacterium antarcticum]PIL11715.1 hypothetical protein P775_28675 [Puniceibacterium antarcticum]
MNMMGDIKPICMGMMGAIIKRAIDPVTSMQAIDNAELYTVAGQVRVLPKQAVAAI